MKIAIIDDSVYDSNKLYLNLSSNLFIENENVIIDTYHNLYEYFKI